MKKKLLFLILSVYLLFIVSVPLVFFFFYGPTQDYRCSVAFDTKNKSFFVIGDSFVLEKVSLNDQDVSWQKKDDVYRSTNFNYSTNKTYRLFVKDKQDNYLDISFRFPQASILDQQIFDFSCKASVVNPKLTINKNNLSFFDGALDTDYVFSEKNGDIINIKNIVVDVQYQTESSRISYGKFFSSLFSETVRYSKIAWHFFVEFNKYIFKISSALFNFTKELSKPIIRGMAKGGSASFNVVYANDNSLWNGVVRIGEASVQRGATVSEHFLKLFKNNYLFVFVSDIGGNSSDFVGSINSNTTDVFRGVNKFFQKTIISERVEKKKQKDVVIQDQLTSKIYTVATELNNVEFLCVNGLGQPLVNERVKVSFKSKIKSNASLLSPMTVYTDNSGVIKLSLRFGFKVSEHELKLKVKNKKFVYNFKTEPDVPFLIKDITNRPMIFQKAGKLVKNAFILKVYDQYNNVVSGAKVNLLEQDIEEQNEAFVFAEAKTDQKGRVAFDYRMNDNSGRVLIIAKVLEMSGRFVYTVQSESTKPVEIVAIGQEEIEAIIGIPIKAPFKVKVLDDNGNPCPHIPVDFSFQTSTFEELETKRVRTDKNGIAEVSFRTPAVVGYFQVVAVSPKVPDYEAAFVVLVMPGDAAKMAIVTGDKQVVEWGKTSEPLVVIVLDDKGNPIPNAEVKWNSQRNVSFVDFDEITDIDGFARAVVRLGETDGKENNVLVQVGKVKEYFKLFPKQPSFYKLDLVSKPVVNVFTGQMLADPIEFVLRDQYGHILGEEKINIEYIVYKRGVQYLQNYTLVTDKEGYVSFNFVASDQKDVINLKGKYFVDDKPRITWVKINVIPEEISNIVVPDFIEGVVGTKFNKGIQVFVADNNASPVVDIFLSVRLKKAPLGANVGKEIEQTYQLKTNRQGMAEFNPVLGNLKGEYIYTAKINTLEKDIIINAVPDKPSRIRLVAKDSPQVQVFKQIDTLSAQLYDKHDNLITRGTLIYDINTSKKVLRHDFNKRVPVNEKGLTPLPFKSPDKKGIYYIYVTDEEYSNTAFYQFEVVESKVNNIILISSEDKDKKYIVGRQNKGIFKTRVVDRFGNLVEKAKLSLDLYPTGSDASSVGADAFTDATGVAAFDIVMPEKSGIYNLAIYSDADEAIRQTVQIEVFPEDVYSAIILSGNNQMVNPGVSFGEDFSIKLQDRYDNPISNEQIRWSYSVDVKGEKRQYIQTGETNFEGISTFNYVTDSNPGVKEIKAYYKKDKKWEYVSYYVKVVGVSVETLKKIAGDEQRVLLGQEIPDFYVVKAFDVNGNPIQDMPIVFQIAQDNKEGKDFVVLEKINRSDNNGIVKQKFSAPVEPGKYKIIVFPQFQDKLKVEFELNVVSEKIKLNAEESVSNKFLLLRLISLQPEKIIVKVGDNARLCEVMLVDRLNNPMPGVVIEWEIYEIAKNITYTRTTRTDNEGKTSLPEINRTYERKFVVKALDPTSKSSAIFNLDILYDIGKEVSLNFIGIPIEKEKDKQIALSKESKIVDVMAEDVIVINDQGIETNHPKKLALYVGQTPHILKVYNNKDRVVVGNISVGKNRYKSNFVIEPKNVLELSLAPDVTQNVEEVTISIVKNRMIPWIKDLVRFNLFTQNASIYSIKRNDQEYRSLFVDQLDFFKFSIKPKVAMIERKNEIDVEISVVPKTGKKIKFNRVVSVDSDFIFENMFDIPGDYRVVVSSYLLENELVYYVKVFDGDNLIRPIKGFGEYKLENDGVDVPIVLDVIYRKTKEKVINDFIIWEIVEKPLGAVVEYQRRSTTNEKGIAENLVSCSSMKGKYTIRARRLFAPEEYFDFVFEIK